MFSKLNLIIMGVIGILLALLISCFFMWRSTVTKLDAVKAELVNAQRTIFVLQSENEKLVQYNLERDKQIKDIEKKYQEQLNKIPSDTCGDTRPSKELLEFLRNA